ncbi:hypothetical protein WICPIJ_001726 [Wickerhamomyces pijperi]|uniref:Ubiquinone biosynthesis O-methyltransferase, mitochondrial n=1 Tax=Wickerhamomyces pijperi TaxID=599730 RepID=A0A9P8TPM1_WICPI|nr:hypothetical protein WICPIJ_001726 [Wickerhamomyces pijperi]
MIKSPNVVRQLKHVSRITSQISSKRLLSTSPILRHQDKKTSTSQDEMDHFNQLASTWWDVNGPQRILHKMNLLRMDFIQSTLRENIPLNEGVLNKEEEIYVPGYSLDLLPEQIRNAIVHEQESKRDQVISQMPKYKILDIGCGGGILTESLARLPTVESVKGIDLSTDVLEAAKLHKALDPALTDKISYQLMPIEDISKSEKYDIITMFEMLEHVNFPSEVLGSALSHLKPNGWLFISTINRDFISWFTTIFMGEYVLNIVPKGTHHLEKYINESEVQDWFKEKPQFEVVKSEGCMYLPFKGWVYSGNASVGNYFMAIRRVK